MDDLLSAFDPLHHSASSRSSTPSSSSTATPSSAPLFPPVSSSSLQAGSSSSSSSSRASAAATLPLQSTSRVPLSQAPLDLLSFDDDDDNDAPPLTAFPSSSSITQPGPPSGVQARAAARQQDILAEIGNADQHVDWAVHGGPNDASQRTTRRPGMGTSPPSASNTRIHHHPPRRMSRSGLMHDDSLRPTLSSFDSSGGHGGVQTGGSYGPPGSISPTLLKKDQAELFHPSSPKDGSTLEAMRQTSYFASLGKGAGKRRQSSSSNGNFVQNIFEHTISPPPPPQHSQPSSQSSKLDQQFFIPSNDDLFLPRSSTSSNRNRPRQATAPVASPPPVNLQSQPAKPVRKQQTFDFSNSFGLGSGEEKSKTASASSSRRPPPSSAPVSASSSLTIDSEPLPPIQLKFSAMVSKNSLVMTEDIADGVSSTCFYLRLNVLMLILYISVPIEDPSFSGLPPPPL